MSHIAAATLWTIAVQRRRSTPATVLFCKLILSLLLATCVPLFSFSGEEHKDAFSTPKNYPLKCNDEQRGKLFSLLSSFQKNGKLNEAEKKEFQKLFSEVPEGCLNKDMEKTILGAFKWLRMVPCDLSKVDKSFELVISSEIHSPDRLRDPKEIYEPLKGYLSQVEDRTAMLAFESVIAPASADPKSGFIRLNADGEFANSYAQLGILASGAQRYKDGLTFQNIAALFLSSDHLRKTWDKMNHDFKDTELNKLAGQIDDVVKFWDELKKNPNPKTDREQTKRKLDLQYWSLALRLRVKSSTVIKLVDAVTAEHLKLLDDPETAFHEVPPRVFKEFKNRSFSDPTFRKQFDQEITSAWRERNLSQTGFELLCKAAKASDGKVRRIVIHGGAAHAIPVYRLMADALKRSDVEGKVKLMLDPAFLRTPEFAAMEKSDLPDNREHFERIIGDFKRVPSKDLLISPDPYLTNKKTTDEISYPEAEFKDTRGAKVSNKRADEIGTSIQGLLKGFRSYGSVTIRSTDENLKSAINLAKEFAGVPSAVSLKAIWPQFSKGSEEPIYLDLFEDGKMKTPVGKIILKRPSIDPRSKEDYESDFRIVFHPAYLRKLGK